MLVERMKKWFLEYKAPRFSTAKRSWYASELLKDARDLYWSATGEPETNQTDLKGHLKMFFGKAIEDGICNRILRNLHWFGLHVYGGDDEQIRVSLSNPDISGKLDGGLLVERSGDTFGKPWVFELKTKYGVGAEYFLKDFNPGEEYLAQMGVYLKRMALEGKTNRGLFLFVMIGDYTLGETVEIECDYDLEKDEIRAYRARNILDIENPKDIDYRLSLAGVFERIKLIEKYVERKELPPQDKVYKKPLTSEYVRTISDANLRKAINGEKILGDWQIIYSRYFDKHIQAQQVTRTYTPDELLILRTEYQRRYPGGTTYGTKTKPVKKGAK